MAVTRALACLVLLGCSNVPERPATDTEMASVSALRAAYAPDLDCESLDPGNVFVWEAPQRVIADYCTGGRTDDGIIACRTGTYGNTPFVPGTRNNTSWDLGWAIHHKIMMHEAAHSLAACEGRGTDRRHERSELWVDALGEAAAAFFMAYPVPDDDAEDPYTRNPRRPWDLTGTRYEGRDCGVQPKAWLHLVPGCEAEAHAAACTAGADAGCDGGTP